jgi:hypothetical protein
LRSISLEKNTPTLLGGALARGLRFVRRLVEPLLRFNLLDRSLALGAQAFGALIPLLIVIEAIEPGDDGVADELIERSDLTGAGAAAVHAAFEVSREPTSTTGLVWIGFLVVERACTPRSTSPQMHWRPPC